MLRPLISAHTTLTWYPFISPGGEGSNRPDEITPNVPTSLISLDQGTTRLGRDFEEGGERGTLLGFQGRAVCDGFAQEASLTLPCVPIHEIFDFAQAARQILPPPMGLQGIPQWEADLCGMGLRSQGDKFCGHWHGVSGTPYLLGNHRKYNNW